MEGVIARWEIALWLALAMPFPAAARRFGPRLWRLVPGWEPYLRSFIPWLHGIGPAYLALITGAISAREFGIAGQPLLGWAGDLLFCASWLAATARFVRAQGDWPKPARGLLDEPRWALYRAAGAAWVGSLPMGALSGLALAVVELGLLTIAQRGGGRPPWESLARAASSTLIFVLTANFWMTLITQGVMLYLLRDRRL